MNQVGAGLGTAAWPGLPPPPPKALAGPGPVTQHPVCDAHASQREEIGAPAPGLQGGNVDVLTSKRVLVQGSRGGRGFLRCCL